VTERNRWSVACLVLGLALVVASGACSKSGSKRPDTWSTGRPRPYNFKVPARYDRNTPTPLVIGLHGYDVLSTEQESYFKLAALADAQTFLYAYPDGSVDGLGHQFWNADDACCDLFGSGVDDVAYLNGMIDDIASNYTVDAKRIFVVGHSNGAFMAHRLACDLPNRIAAIVALAGAGRSDASKCNPQSPVSTGSSPTTAGCPAASRVRRRRRGRRTRRRRRRWRRGPRRTGARGRWRPTA
jgi:polyhydroxybutyrate depolymerase